MEKKMNRSPKIKRKTRRKSPSIKVYCLDAEKAAIEVNAVTAGKSVSEFLRAVGIGYRVESALDNQNVRELARINADQSRLGGLLKLLLTNDERFEGMNGTQLQQTTHSLLKQIENTQTRMRETVQTILRKPT